MIYTLPISLFVIGAFLLSLFLVISWIFKSLLIIFIVFLFFKAHKEYVKRILFFEDGIEVIHVFGYKQFYSFDQVKSFRTHRMGFFYYDVIRIRLVNNKKKMAFYCPPNVREEFYSFLKSRGFIVNSQI